MDYPPLGAQTLFEASRPAQPALPDEVLECMTGPNFPFEQLKGNLALTDDQHQQIYKIECKYLAQIDPLLAQLKASARQLNALMTAPQLAPDQVRTLQAQINQQRDAIANLFAEQQIASMQALSADQRSGLSVAMIKGFPSVRIIFFTSSPSSHCASNSILSTLLPFTFQSWRTIHSPSTRALG